MTKDYAKRRRPHVAPRRRSYYAEPSRTFMPGWAWISTGVIFGIVLSGGLYWKLHHATAKQPLVVAIQEENPAATTTSKQKKSLSQKAKTTPVTTQHTTASSSRFDFYTVLPSMSVDGPTEVDPSATTPSTVELALNNQIKTQSQPTVKTKDNSDTIQKYMIQAGSFRQLSQAEELKAELAFAGFEASIQTFKMGPKETRYRVLIGPFASLDIAHNQQQQLEQSQSLHSVVLKIGV